MKDQQKIKGSAKSHVEVGGVKPTSKQRKLKYRRLLIIHDLNKKQ